MAEEKTDLEIDDWLDDLAEDKPGGQKEEVVASGPSSDSDGAGEFEQADIDALLEGGVAADFSVAGGAGDGFTELDQSDIDSLLGGEEESAVAAGDDFDLGQSDLDDLFAGGAEKEAGEPVMSVDLRDEETDGVITGGLAEVAQGGSAQAETSVSGEENAGLPDNSRFDDDDEFDFGDLPDIPDETKTGGRASSGGGDEEDLFAALSSTEAPDFRAETAKGVSREKPSVLGGKDDPPIVPPSASGKKKALALAALALVLMLLMGGGGYWYMKSKGLAPLPPPAPEQHAAVGEAAAPPTASPVAPPNAPPVANESRWRMSQANESLAIELSGADENNDPLKFEVVTPPKFGRLSGELPKITYLPNKDFPGEDSFEFLVSDGHLASPPAKVGIMGPEEVKPVAVEEPKDVPPERTVVAAKNVRLTTMSTAPLTIDWKRIWAAANPQPFAGKVSVEILGGPPLRGALRPLDRARHLYEPDRYFDGQEMVRYRFKSAGVFSKAGKLLITVKGNDKPPVLALRPMADSYKVGESVVLDAGLTRDDSPGGLQYSWEQVAGPPVPLTKLHKEGSAVSFVAPSSFRGEQKNRIVIRVTATDPGGQRASKEIGITLVSKRQTALWGIAE